MTRPPVARIGSPVGRMSWPGRAAVLSIAVLAGALPAGRVLAQEDPRLTDAVRLAQDGQGDSARATVARLLAATPPSDTLFPQVLYTSGLVARSVDDMRRAYQRIAVEYATSSWADDALLRLAMLDYAAGNPTGSTHNLERIHSDYPSSPLLPVASYWAARAYFDQRRPADACRWLKEGLALVGDNIELQNQLNFYQGRCTVLAAQPAETTKADTASKRPSPPPSPPKPGFAVQVAAVKTRSAADKVVSALKAVGFDSRVIEHNNLFKVRVGHYADHAGAQAVVSQIKVKLGGAPYVVPEP